MKQLTQTKQIPLGIYGNSIPHLHGVRQSSNMLRASACSCSQKQPFKLQNSYMFLRTETTEDATQSCTTWSCISPRRCFSVCICRRTGVHCSTVGRLHQKGDEVESDRTARRHRDALPRRGRARVPRPGASTRDEGAGGTPQQDPAIRRCVSTVSPCFFKTI